MTATVGKAQAPKLARDGLCQRTAGMLTAGSASSPAGRVSAASLSSNEAGSNPPNRVLA